jgi:hypothetical protein
LRGPDSSYNNNRITIDQCQDIYQPGPARDSQAL